mmetsp:Transcript_10946/g.46734  ORF Transcript_10946/g.46734 Transcript_10946/m.46734 type:complete len:216 (+) Transcript_10946:225-872(+)
MTIDWHACPSDAAPVPCDRFLMNAAIFSTLVLSSAASTSSSTKKGDERYEWIAKSSASAAMVFSPPLSCSMSRNRFVGGIAVNFTPWLYGSSGDSSERYAVPPRGCDSLWVSSLYTRSMAAAMCSNADMNVVVRSFFSESNVSCVSFVRRRAVSKSSACARSRSFTLSYWSMAFMLGSSRASAAAFASVSARSSSSRRSRSLGRGACFRRCGRPS